mgnify:CR=1 FL=1
MGKDYYQILGVRKEASNDEIKKAYRKMAHKYHPDKAGGDESKFKEINEAYQVLSDEAKRRRYDQFGSADAGQGGGYSGGFGGFDFNNFNFGGTRSGGFEDIFSDIFSSAGFGSAQSSFGREANNRGSDIEVDLEISFFEMARGGKKEISLYKRVVCPVCNGTGSKDGKMKKCGVCGGTGKVRKTVQSFFGTFIQTVVCEACNGQGETVVNKCGNCGGDGVVRDYEKIEIEIPAGIENETTLKIQGKGETAGRGGRSGDLFVNLRVKEDPIFKRSGRNIISNIDVPFSKAALGGKIDVQTVDGPITIKIPAGSRSGDFLKIKNRGIGGTGFFSKGDHLAKVRILVPEKLSSRQKKLIQQLADEGL